MIAQRSATSDNSAPNRFVAAFHFDAPQTPARELEWTFAYGLPIVLVLLHATLAWFGREPGFTGQDDSRYFVLAESLRQGQFRDLIYPGAPAHHMYPPGYPGLLALWSVIGGDGFNWLVVLHILLSVGTLVLTFDAVRRVMPPAVALLSLAVLAVNLSLLKYAGRVSSEGALALCFAVAVWGSVVIPRGRRQTLVVLAAAITAPWMRAAGVVLPAALVVCWLSERRYRDAAVLAAVGSLIVAPLMYWIMRDPAVVVGGSYAADMQATVTDGSGMLMTLLRRVPTSISYYGSTGFPRVLAVPTIEGTIADNIAWAVLISTGLLVGMISGFARFRLSVLSLIATGALLVVWIFQSDRFLVPLLSLFVPLMLLGLANVGSSRRRIIGVALSALCALLIIGQNLVLDAQNVVAMSRCDRSQTFPDSSCVSTDLQSFFRAAAYVRDSLPAEALVISLKSAPLYHYTHHLTVPFQLHAAGPDSMFWRAMSDQHAEYVLLGNLHYLDSLALAPRLLRRCETLRVVGAFAPRTYLFRVLPSTRTEIATPTNAITTSGACDALRSYLAAAKQSSL